MSGTRFKWKQINRSLRDNKLSDCEGSAKPRGLTGTGEAHKAAKKCGAFEKHQDEDQLRKITSVTEHYILVGVRLLEPARTDDQENVWKRWKQLLATAG